jgi:hypothetical protein
LRKPMVSIFFLTLMFAIAAATSMAETISISPTDVVYKVNEGGLNLFNETGYKNTPASSFFDANDNVVHLKVTDAGYQDVGILLYFGGGLTLGQLQNLTITTTEKSAPLSIALWLDTDHSGGFLNSLGKDYIPADHGGDSRFGNKWDFTGTLILSSILYQYELNGIKAPDSEQKESYQAYALGNLPIDPNTPVAIWIGIDNKNLSGCERDADISKIEINTVPEPSLLILLGIGFGAAGLVSWRRK